LLDGGATTEKTKCMLFDNTGATILEQVEITPTVATTHKIPVGGVSIFTTGSNPPEQLMQVIHATSNASAESGIQEVCILAVELTERDVFNSSLGATDTTSGTYANKVSITITPPSAGDYLIIGHSTETESTTSTNGKTQLYNGTTGINPIEGQDNKGIAIQPFTYMARVTNLSSPQTWSIQHARYAGSGTATIANARLLALRLADFPAAYWAEDRTPHTSTGAYQDSAVVGPVTPAAADHMVIATGLVTMSANGLTTLAGNKINATDGDVGTTFSQETAFAGFRKSWLALRKRTETATSTTWKTRYSRVSGTETITSQDHVIAVLRLL
jgi:hypothetical protein